MKLYLYGHAALEYWGVPRLRGNVEPENSDFSDEFVAFTKGSIHKPMGANIHTCKIKGAEKYCRGIASSIPLAVLQVAKKYSIVELIYIILQTISGYFGQQPKTTIDEIYDCAFTLEKHHGRRKTLRALKYVSPECRSPMETYLYMLLCLPNALGGRGFSKFVFNKSIITRGGYHYIADLIWPEKKLILEYQGRDHNKPENIKKDLIRKINLEAEGYTVLFVQYEDLKELDRFEALVDKICKITKTRQRIRTPMFIHNYTKIRDMMIRRGEFKRKPLVCVHKDELPNQTWISRLYKVYLRMMKLLIKKCRNDFNISYRQRWPS